MNKKLVDINSLDSEMYRKSFETDDGRQRWNSGLWIRYKIWEEARDAAKVVDAPPVRHGSGSLMQKGIGLAVSVVTTHITAIWRT